MIGETTSSVLDEQLHTASIEFIFCNHARENLIKVANAVLASDGDIIAVEKIREDSFGMGTEEEKQLLSEQMTHFIAPDSDITQSASEYFQTDDPFFGYMLDELKGSGKRIVLIDMGTDSEGYEYRQNSQSTRFAYAESLQQHADNSEDLQLDSQIAAAQSNEYREHVMKEQLTSLAQANPGLKITVMAGAMHTPMSHNLDPFIRSTRIFVPSDKEEAAYSPGEKMRFEEPWLTERILRFNLEALGLSTIKNTTDV